MMYMRRLIQSLRDKGLGGNELQKALKEHVSSVKSFPVTQVRNHRVQSFAGRFGRSYQESIKFGGNGRYEPSRSVDEGVWIFVVCLLIPHRTAFITISSLCNLHSEFMMSQRSEDFATTPCTGKLSPLTISVRKEDFDPIEPRHDCGDRSE